MRRGSNLLTIRMNRTKKWSCFVVGQADSKCKLSHSQEVRLNRTAASLFRRVSSVSSTLRPVKSFNNGRFRCHCPDIMQKRKRKKLWRCQTPWEKSRWLRARCPRQLGRRKLRLWTQSKVAAYLLLDVIVLLTSFGVCITLLAHH